MDTQVSFLKDTVTKVQGYADPEPVEPKEPEPPAKKLTLKEEEQENNEKMKLFSEFVAANAEETLKQEVKRVDPMKKPLHFKYYANDGEEEGLTEDTTDDILGAASAQLTKGKVDLKYDHSDAGWNVQPL